MIRTFSHIAMLLVMLATAACATAVMNTAGTGDSRAGEESPAIRDARITREVRTKIYRDFMLDDRRIQVSTAGGIVTLTGTVENHREARRAEELAYSVEGVRGVDLKLILRN
jgi:osmotically-inducible protein OsmY